MRDYEFLYAIKTCNDPDTIKIGHSYGSRKTSARIKSAFDYLPPSVGALLGVWVNKTSRQSIEEVAHLMFKHERFDRRELFHLTEDQSMVVLCEKFGPSIIRRISHAEFRKEGFEKLCCPIGDQDPRMYKPIPYHQPFSVVR